MGETRISSTNSDGKRNRPSLFVLNGYDDRPGLTLTSHCSRASASSRTLLLGWTALGWIAAFIWSLTAVQATPSPTAPPPPPSPSSPPETEAEPTPVENLITAKGGQLTYRVMAYRRMEKGELERAVWEALESGELKEPESGGIATLVTDIGR